VAVTHTAQGSEAPAPRVASHGLAGMRHRVETAKGRLTVSSEPGQGTRLSASLPSSGATPAAPAPARQRA
jgi:glucose-6-phosphate-specific signal transduction histidine kinase